MLRNFMILFTSVCLGLDLAAFAAVPSVLTAFFIALNTGFLYMWIKVIK